MRMSSLRRGELLARAIWACWQRYVPCKRCSHTRCSLCCDARCLYVFAQVETRRAEAQAATGDTAPQGFAITAHRYDVLGLVPSTEQDTQCFARVGYTPRHEALAFHSTSTGSGSGAAGGSSVPKSAAGSASAKSGGAAGEVTGPPVAIPQFLVKLANALPKKLAGV